MIAEDYELNQARAVWAELPPEVRQEIPEHLRGGLDRYFTGRIRCGGFLDALLADELAGCVHRADREMLLTLPLLLQILYSWAPGKAWGSREAVERWVKGRE